MRFVVRPLVKFWVGFPCGRWNAVTVRVQTVSVIGDTAVGSACVDVAPPVTLLRCCLASSYPAGITEYFRLRNRCLPLRSSAKCRQQTNPF